MAVFFCPAVLTGEEGIAFGRENMQVKKDVEPGKDTRSSEPFFTQEELWQEFCYVRAERITKRLLEQGLITGEEFQRIMAENRKSFPTYLSSIF